ncbi:MAG: MATE family efflux transporter, partial [Clostridia bacterium]|nr:MATE family efflux transporter [Clostridia bacterium]
MKFKSLVGDRKFYKTLLGVAIPIMIQNAVTTFVSLLDNIMVGAVGTETMSGVSIVNQFLFVFSLLAFGVVSAGSIFSAQFFGGSDIDGV